MSQSLVAYRMVKHVGYSDCVGFYNWNFVEAFDQKKVFFSDVPSPCPMCCTVFFKGMRTPSDDDREEPKLKFKASIDSGVAHSCAQ